MAIGFVLLIKGADFLVNGASSLAKRFNISDIAIGLTVVAMGTSAPELVVNLISGGTENDDLVFGNIIGSNIFNILAVMGVTIMVADIPVPESFLRFDLWVMLGSSALLLPFVLTRSKIGRVTGAGFTVAYILYIYALGVNEGLF